MMGARWWATGLVVAALVAAIGGASVAVFDAGRKAERSEWLTKQAAEAVRMRSEFDADLRAANAATTAAQADAQQARDFNAQLQQEIQHAQAPLIVRTAAACSPRKLVVAADPAGDPAAGRGAVPVADAAGGVPGGVGRERTASTPWAQHAASVALAAAPATEPAASAADQPPTAALDDAAHAQPGDAQPLEPGGGAVLTLAAVRLWNSALAGAELPAGACSADAAASGACAAASTASLTDAWANHAENAARCRIDRGNYQRLTDYLRERDARRDAAGAATAATHADTTTAAAVDPITTEHQP